MSNLFPMNKTSIVNLNTSWGWLLVWGIALVILGVLAITFSFSSTLISVIFLGFLLAISGLVIIFDAFKSWWGKWTDFFMHLGMGILYLLVGIMFIQGPVLTSISLTFILAVFYIIIGLYRVFYSLYFDLPNRGWRVFSGILALLLGILILAEWPMSGLFIIGLFIGIDLLIIGWVYIVAALTARKSAN